MTDPVWSTTSADPSPDALTCSSVMRAIAALREAATWDVYARDPHEAAEALGVSSHLVQQREIIPDGFLVAIKREPGYSWFSRGAFSPTDAVRIYPYKTQEIPDEPTP